MSWLIGPTFDSGHLTKEMIWNRILVPATRVKTYEATIRSFKTRFELRGNGKPVTSSSGTNKRQFSFEPFPFEQFSLEPFSFETL